MKRYPFQVVENRVTATGTANASTMRHAARKAGCPGLDDRCAPMARLEDSAAARWFSRPRGTRHPPEHGADGAAGGLPPRRPTTTLIRKKPGAVCGDLDEADGGAAARRAPGGQTRRNPGHRGGRRPARRPGRGPRAAMLTSSMTVSEIRDFPENDPQGETIAVDGVDRAYRASLSYRQAVRFFNRSFATGGFEELDRTSTHEATVWSLRCPGGERLTWRFATRARRHRGRRGQPERVGPHRPVDNPDVRSTLAVALAPRLRTCSDETHPAKSSTRSKARSSRPSAQRRATRSSRPRESSTRPRAT